MTRAMELELEISDLEIKIENGNTDEQLLRELNEKRVLLAQKTRKTDRKTDRKMSLLLGYRFEGIRTAQLNLAHR